MSKLPYSGQTSAYEHKHGDAWKETTGAGKPAVRDVKLIEAQWTNMPIEVERDVVALWYHLEYGNDDYYWHGSLDGVREYGKSGNCVNREFNGKEWVEEVNNLEYLIQ